MSTPDTALPGVPLRTSQPARGLRGPLRLTATAFLPVCIAALAAMTIGRYPLSIADLFDFIGASLGLVDMPQDRYRLLFNVVVQIRLPRVAAAVLVGAALASSGAAYQSVFRNPLVSPGLLGVLAGAAFGAALGIVVGLPWAVVQVISFAFGGLAVFAALGVGNLFGRASLITLVLGGVISTALFSSLLSMVKYVADPYNQLPTIVYWLMGSLANAELGQIGWFAIPIALGVAALALLGRALDALSMGDDEALAMGVPVVPVRYAVIGIATLLSALTVSIVGMIGWVGLVVPHIARLAIGPGNARLLPVAASLGAAFVLVADAIARTATTAEIPIGIVTELIGIPAFLLVLRRARRGWA